MRTIASALHAPRWSTFSSFSLLTQCCGVDGTAIVSSLRTSVTRPASATPRFLSPDGALHYLIANRTGVVGVYQASADVHQ